ncbi:MAG: hypothetical protein D3914_05550 [Candidatus Electrothrix sp. LOE2]|nr:hypothetical protein [Candidatus Electrothrix sp. LOE2]
MIKSSRLIGKIYFDVFAGQLFAPVNFRASLAPFHHSNAIIPPKAATANIGEITAAFATVAAAVPFAAPAVPAAVVPAAAVPAAAVPFAAPAVPAATVASAIIFLLFQWLYVVLSVERNKKELVCTPLNTSIFGFTSQAKKITEPLQAALLLFPFPKTLPCTS